MDYLWLFLSGLLAFNSLPHLTHGISGQRWFLPSRDRTHRYPAFANVLWGFANIVVAAVIWRFVFGWSNGFSARILAILVGGLLVALVISHSFAKRAAAAPMPDSDQNPL